jgi:ABC-type phosphate transport system auxiliary subunit
MKGASINAIILIIILLFVNIGFAVKMFNKYYKMKETGYMIENTFQEQIEQRIMKSFGNREELNKLINDFVRFKEASEQIAISFKKQSEQLKLVSKEFEDSKSNFEEEKARLQKEMWVLEDSLSHARNTLRDRGWEIHELTGRLRVVEDTLLKKQLEEYSNKPGNWKIPVQ